MEDDLYWLPNSVRMFIILLGLATIVFAVYLIVVRC